MPVISAPAQEVSSMVPGMTERERLAADVRRLDWLAEARFGPVQPAATVQLALTASPLSNGRRALTAMLLLGQRIRSLPSRATPANTEPSATPAQ
jgi:hypothetical protein